MYLSITSLTLWLFIFAYYFLRARELHFKELIYCPLFNEIISTSCESAWEVIAPNSIDTPLWKSCRVHEMKDGSEVCGWFEKCLSLRRNCEKKCEWKTAHTHRNSQSNRCPGSKLLGINGSFCLLCLFSQFACPGVDLISREISSVSLLKDVCRWRCNECWEMREWVEIVDVLDMGQHFFFPSFAFWIFKDFYGIKLWNSCLPKELFSHLHFSFNPD